MLTWLFHFGTHICVRTLASRRVKFLISQERALHAMLRVKRGGEAQGLGGEADADAGVRNRKQNRRRCAQGSTVLRVQQHTPAAPRQTAWKSSGDMA